MQALVCPAQFLKGRFEESLVLDSLSRTHGGKPIQPHINAACCRFFHRDLVRHFDLDGDKPPIRCSRDPCACDFPFEAEILCHIDPTELGNPETMIAQLKLIVGEIEAWFAPLLALELWAAGTALKERRKRLA